MIDNTERVSLKFLIYSSSEWPVSWWLLASFTSGVIVGYGFSFFSSLKREKPFVPSERDDLVKLPGVGRKTANVVLNTFFGKPYIAVDTHLFRLGNRIGLAKGKTPLEVENRYMDTIPKWALKNAHHWLILHGRYTCKAKNPNCDSCEITKYCEFYLKEKIYD